MSKLRSVKNDVPDPQHWEVMLPCPFCNGAGKLLSNEAHHKGSGIGASAVVCCSRCGAGGPVVEPEDERPIAAIERHATRLWNKRGSHQGAEWKLRRIAALLNSEFSGAG